MPDTAIPSESFQNNPPEWLADFALPDGSLVRFRRVCAEDETLIATAISSASRETLLHRFFSPIRSVAPDQLRRMLVLDPAHETCIVGVLDTNSARRIVCGARYVKLPEPTRAEIAITVHDDFQQLGLGTLSLRLVARLALAEGIGWFEAEVLSSNHKMLKLIRKISQGRAQGNWTGDVYHVQIPVALLATEAWDRD